jgi:hypothetical protein
MRSTNLKATLVVAAVIAALFVALREVQGEADEQVPVRFAVQTTQDVPVRAALYGEADRGNTAIDQVQWRGGYRSWYGYRSYYAPRYYSYYPYYPRPYYSYYYGPAYGNYYGPRVAYLPWYRW